MRDRYFEDFEAGQRFVSRGATLSEAQILEFAWAWDPQPFHIDEQAAAESDFGGLIASGFHTLLVAFRLFHQEGIWNAASMGSPGMEEVRWIRPVRPGDSLHVVAEVRAVRPSRSKPDRGNVTFRYEARNQRDETVMSFTAVQILRRRPSEP